MYPHNKEQIDALLLYINHHPKWTEELRKKINYKFRLEWNYCSNSMEGNSLTIDETRSVMVGNITVNGKPMKDILEVWGHDNIVREILKIGKSETRLSERRIKEVHKAIMHEENEEQKAKIGVWKTEANCLYNYKGEKFSFLEPAEVPEAMHQLLNATNAKLDAFYARKKQAPHPLDIAFQFHLDFVSIHPFYDGNGRTARIFTNLLLISLGYPPFWVNDTERNIYNQYLADVQAYGGEPDLLFGFMSGLVLRSVVLIEKELAAS